ncbi:MAG: zinc ribbon domain-containing protein [Anaerolineales bacterium]|nr:zinc ribbon domain-containing protein [Anaerolineales bacterium]
MPIYTYRCESCGIQFDRQQHFDDQPLARCPECNEKSLRKVYLPVGIVFKGSGFYATDHRSPSGQVSTKKSENGAKKDKTETTPKTSPPKEE